MRSKRRTMGKNGLSTGVGEGGGGNPWRYLRLGEKSLMTSGQTFSFSMKLNSGCCTHTHTHTHIHTTLSANSQLAVEVVKSIVKNNQKTLFFHRNILASTTMKRTTNGGEDGRVGGEDRYMKTKSTNGKDFRVGEDRHMKTKSTNRRWQSRR